MSVGAEEANGKRPKEDGRGGRRARAVGGRRRGEIGGGSGSKKGCVTKIERVNEKRGHHFLLLASSEETEAR